MKLNPCAWCGKYGRNASDWEQLGIRPATEDDDPADYVPSALSSPQVSQYKRLCVRCANRRLNNPYNALLPMRKITTP